jgi:hypothetical protein
MKTLIAVLVLAGAGLLLLTLRRLARERARRNHDPVEYYRVWTSYHHPIHLQDKITQEEAYAIAASGSPYLIGYFDADGKLTRAVKMLRGAMFFDFVYAYYPNGKVKRVQATNTRGEVTVREYDGSRRPVFFW